MRTKTARKSRLNDGAEALKVFLKKDGKEGQAFCTELGVGYLNGDKTLMALELRRNGVTETYYKTDIGEKCFRLLEHFTKIEEPLASFQIPQDFVVEMQNTKKLAPFVGGGLARLMAFSSEKRGCFLTMELVADGFYFWRDVPILEADAGEILRPFEIVFDGELFCKMMGRWSFPTMFVCVLKRSDVIIGREADVTKTMIISDVLFGEAVKEFFKGKTNGVYHAIAVMNNRRSFYDNAKYVLDEALEIVLRGRSINEEEDG